MFPQKKKKEKKYVFSKTTKIGGVEDEMYRYLASQ